MRAFKFSTIWLFFIVLGGAPGAQESRTEVMVKAPSTKLEGKTFDKVRIAVNGNVKFIDPGETADFTVAASAGENLNLQIRAINKGTFSDATVQTWNAAIPLSGSGHVSYTALSLGQGVWGEWPSVIFHSDALLFDIFLDSAPTPLGTIGGGRPDLKKGIKPDQNHTLIWRSSSTDVCSKAVKLPENVSRTYICDAKTKQVSEK